MFALTSRLLLRPGWPEDAPMLARAIAHEPVARMTSRVPWPYGLADAEAFLARPHDPLFPECLVFERSASVPRLIGGVGVYAGGETHELGYWITPSAWGRGFATEAARAMVDHVRHGLAAARVEARHFVDNPGSGRVLRKLGFQPTGVMASLPSVARGRADAAVHHALCLRRTMMPMAA
ncbi:MAG: GNAT family N-acetyltransferase [Janthinobacterium lividum]